MDQIAKLYEKYKDLIDSFDLGILICHILKKERQFILSHPEFALKADQLAKINELAKKRQKGVLLAYLIGNKEFFGLEFQVDKNVLIPRPETEFLVEETLKLLKTINYQLKTKIIDVGTGSGNIIISIVKNLVNQPSVIGHHKFFATDISQKAINIAKQNAKYHKVSSKIKFLKGNLLNPIINNSKFPATAGSRQGGDKIQNSKFIIIANLPYVSEKNYQKYYSQIKFEPRSALLSENCGLFHYENLFSQVNKMMTDGRLPITIIFEFSPEQKNKIESLIKKYFPRVKIIFKKDLAGKWRMAKIIF